MLATSTQATNALGLLADVALPGSSGLNVRQSTDHRASESFKDLDNVTRSALRQKRLACNDDNARNRHASPHGQVAKIIVLGEDDTIIGQRKR